MKLSISIKWPLWCAAYVGKKSSKEKPNDDNFFILVGGGTSAYEAMLEKKRAALRRALRHEYLKTLYNPDLVTFLYFWNKTKK